MRTHVFFIIVISSVIAFSASAAPRCKDLFNSSNSFSYGFHELEDPLSFQLPKAFTNEILKHPIMRLRERFRNKKMIFKSQYYPENTPLLQGSMGEKIQSVLIAKTLKIIFQNPEFVSRSTHLLPDNNSIATELFIHDPAETNSNSTDVLSMPILKAANPGLSSIPHGYFKEKMRIPNHKKILNIYTKDHKETAKEAVLSSLRTLEPDYIFITKGGMTLDARVADYWKGIVGEEYQVILLSQFKDQIVENKKYLILNDLAGRLAHIANISDLSIIAGPINFFEPLSAGSKTVILANEDIRGSYRDTEYKYMLEIAQSTDGVYVATTLSSLDKVLQTAWESDKTPAAVYQMRAHAEAKSPVEDYLDMLLRYIVKHAKN